jgi:tetrahydromethanopterin S-methyltransferase subunit C
MDLATLEKTVSRVWRTVQTFHAAEMEIAILERTASTAYWTVLLHAAEMEIAILERTASTALWTVLLHAVEMEIAILERTATTVQGIADRVPLCVEMASARKQRTAATVQQTVSQGYVTLPCPLPATGRAVARVCAQSWQETKL